MASFQIFPSPGDLYFGVWWWGIQEHITIFFHNLAWYASSTRAIREERMVIFCPVIGQL